MAHSKDFRNYPAYLNALAEALAGKKEQVEYETNRKAAEYDRAVFYAFRAAAKQAADAGDHEARIVMMGLNGARFIITPARDKAKSTNEDTVRVTILAWTTLGEHPLAQALRATTEEEENV